MARSCSVCRDKNIDAINIRIQEGVGSQQLAEDYGLTRAAIDSHRTSGHAARELTRQVLGAVATGGPLSEFAKIAIASKTHRIQALDDIKRKIETVFRERAEAYANLPGGETGLIGMRKKMLGQGPSAYEVEECFFDKDLVSEYRACLEQAAKEAGEWKPDNGQKAEAMAKLAQSIVIHSAVLAHDSCESRELDKNTKNDQQVIDITVDPPSE